MSCERFVSSWHNTLPTANQPARIMSHCANIWCVGPLSNFGTKICVSSKTALASYPLIVAPPTLLAELMRTIMQERASFTGGMAAPAMGCMGSRCGFRAGPSDCATLAAGATLASGACSRVARHMGQIRPLAELFAFT